MESGAFPVNRKPCACSHPRVKDPFGRLQKELNSYKGVAEEPCSCIYPVTSGSSTHQKPEFQKPCDCHGPQESKFPVGPSPAPRESRQTVAASKFSWKTAVIIVVAVLVILTCCMGSNKEVEGNTKIARKQKSDFAEMMDDVKEMAGEFLDVTTEFLGSMASVIKETDSGKTTVIKSAEETEEDEEEEDGQIPTFEQIKNKGKNLINMGKEIFEGNYVEKEVEKPKKAMKKDGKKSKGRKASETVVTKDADGHGFTAQRRTRTEKVYEIPDDLKEFYEDDRLGLGSNGNKEDL